MSDDSVYQIHLNAIPYYKCSEFSMHATFFQGLLVLVFYFSCAQQMVYSKLKMFPYPCIQAIIQLNLCKKKKV